MRDITAQLVTRDCTTVGCRDEADGPDGICRRCRAARDRPRVAWDPTEALRVIAPAPPEREETQHEEIDEMTETPDRDTVLEQLRAFHGEHGRAPKQTELADHPALPSGRACHELFGGLGKACEAAGVPFTRQHGPNPDFTLDEIVAAYFRWETETGRAPTSANWNTKQDGYPGYSSVRKHFQSWPEFAAHCEGQRTAPEPAPEPGEDDPPEPAAATEPDPQPVTLHVAPEPTDDPDAPKDWTEILDFAPYGYEEGDDDMGEVFLSMVADMYASALDELRRAREQHEQAVAHARLARECFADYTAEYERLADQLLGDSEAA